MILDLKIAVNFSQKLSQFSHPPTCYVIYHIGSECGENRKRRYCIVSFTETYKQAKNLKYVTMSNI